MRVVIDTNVFVSSFFGGLPRRVIDLWKNGSVVLCLTNAIIDEYFAVLKRMGLSETEELNELLNLFRTQFNCVFTSKTPALALCTDKDDNKFIEAAVALNATAIISGDNHLKLLKNYAGISICSPRDFLDTI